MSEKNPRYPHWCRIIRKTEEDPMVDEDDFTPLQEEEYDPMGGDEDEQHDSVSSDVPSEEETPAEDGQITVIYEGVCRSYKVNTTSDKGELITSQRGLALPMNQDMWDSAGTLPKEGDEVVVVYGSSLKEYGRVVDKNVSTATYSGTHIFWRYSRN